MSTVFTDFLRELAAKKEAEERAGKGMVEEWRTAIEKLFDQIRGWLAESDPDGIIQIEQKEHELIERGLGRYRVPRLDLRILDKWIVIIPKARKTVGSAKPPQRSAPERAAGRVDITDETRRYVLYRFPQDGAEDVWLIDDLGSEPRPLDRQAFEMALLSYIR
jgi:hypothetical protein